MDIETSLKATGYADVIVVLESALENEAFRAAAAEAAPARLARHFTRPETSQDAELVELLTSRQRTFSAARASGGTNAATVSAAAVPESPVRYFSNLGLLLGTVDRSGLKGLKQEGTVKQIMPAPQLRLIRPVTAAATQVQAGYTWGLQYLGIDKLHGEGFNGKGVLIAHLDTGVDASHPALAGVVKYYAEFDALGNQVPKAKPKDSDEHGTHTAGTLCGQAIKGVRFGVAPEARLASAMVIEGGNVTARILGGMNWAVGKRARVLSMSLGLVGYNPAFTTVLTILRARGVLPVVAVGNEGPGTSRYPGNYPEVLSVGAMDSSGQVADFSGSQRFKRKVDPLVPDLVGPGVDVVSCTPGGNYAQMSGSSMATPHIAGLCALLMQAKPKATIDEIEAAVFASCSLQPGMAAGRANRGVPDGPRALSLL